MKLVVAFIPVLFFSCTAEKKDAPSIPLPYKEKGINLLDSTTRQIKWKDLTLQIKFKTLDGNRFVYEDSPFLFSIDANGKIIDSLKLFDHKPYVGTDSYYLPWLEISEAGIVTTTDTNIYYPNSTYVVTSEGKLEGPERQMDTAITVHKFKINKHGIFSKVKLPR